MPFYDFSCVECGYGEEHLDLMTGPKIRECPACKKHSYVRLIGTGAGIQFSTSLKDKSGENIWFPKDGKPYFDQGLRRVFKSPQEKKNFMDANNIVSDGSMDGTAKKKQQLVEEARYNAKTDSTEKRKEKCLKKKDTKVRSTATMRAQRALQPAT